MPRPKSQTRERMVARALPRFWRYGYGATSIDDLVRSTGASRHALYQEFGDKRGLFLACLDHYRDAFVTPAFGPVEQADAGLEEIAGFLDYQIARSERAGLPGVGCLFANTMTEVAPHDPEIAARVRAHNTRLAQGFAAVFRRAAQGDLSQRASAELGEALASSVQGLWSISRVTTDARTLRQHAAALLQFAANHLPDGAAPIRKR